MRRFEVVTHVGPAVRNGEPARSGFWLRAGVPDGLDATLQPGAGVPRGAPAISLTYFSGDDGRTGQRVNLPTFRPDDARRLAWALMEAADAAESPEEDSEDLQGTKE